MDDLDTPQDHPDPSRRRRQLLVALGVAAAAAVAAVVTLAWPSGSTHHPAGAVRPPAASALPHPPSATTPAAPLPTAVPTVGPAVTWQAFQGVVLPYSPTAGPTVIRGPVYAGYAHTPTGALIATAQIGYRFGLTPTPGWRTVTLAQVMPGPGRDLYVTERAQAGDAVGTGELTQIVGYRFLGYTPALAVVDVLTRDTSGNLQSDPSTVVWSAGDWRLSLPADGGGHAQVIPNLDGYVPWSGVS